MNDDDPGPYQRKPLRFILAILALCAGLSMQAQEARGLSLSIDAGCLFADNYQANFYQGIPSNLNTIERILHSEQFGYYMWQDLTNQGLISSNIGNYRQLSIEEYGQMRYRLAIQLGMGMRYDFGRDWAWLLRFNYARLTAEGQFLLNSGRNNSVTLTNQDAYVVCPIMGKEKRILIDFGFSKRFALHDGQFLQADLGVSLNNTHVEANDILVAGRQYSILDVWGGQSPDAYTPAYDYLNQGGIGYGGFFTLAYGLRFPDGNSVLLHYTLYYSRTNLPGYTVFNPQNLFGLRFELAKF